MVICRSTRSEDDVLAPDLRCVARDVEHRLDELLAVALDVQARS